MDIYVGNLSANTTERELQKFFKGYGKQITIKINKFICKDGTLYFAIVDIESDKIAQKAIRKLHCQKIHGKPVVVREYQYRAGNNDRRAMNWRNHPWTQLERRALERRKKYKLANKREPEFSAYDNLVSKGI